MQLYRLETPNVHSTAGLGKRDRQRWMNSNNSIASNLQPPFPRLSDATKEIDVHRVKPGKPAAAETCTRVREYHRQICTIHPSQTSVKSNCGNCDGGNGSGGGWGNAGGRHTPTSAAHRCKRTSCASNVRYTVRFFLLEEECSLKINSANKKGGNFWDRRT